ncbi:hypothetical protein QJS66_11130 [Kocuria rhizophila]|nr:hypothetical protein QJS66_11130 [Kocuria rhizophila]
MPGRRGRWPRAVRAADRVRGQGGPSSRTGSPRQWWRASCSASWPAHPPEHPHWFVVAVDRVRRAHCDLLTTQGIHPPWPLRLPPPLPASPQPAALVVRLPRLGNAGSGREILPPVPVTLYAVAGAAPAPRSRGRAHGHTRWRRRRGPGRGRRRPQRPPRAVARRTPPSEATILRQPGQGGVGLRRCSRAYAEWDNEREWRGEARRARFRSVCREGVEI